MYNVCRGIDERSVKNDRQRKSLAAERTFSKDIFDSNSFRTVSRSILEEVWRRYENYSRKGRSLSIKLKYSDFSQITRSSTLTKEILTFSQLEKMTQPLIENVLPLEKPVRLIGFQISGFTDENVVKQIELEF